MTPVKMSLNQVLEQVIQGKHPIVPGIEIVPQVFFHHVNVAATSTGTGEFRFFNNTTPDDVISNWPGANGLPSNQRFACESVGFDCEPNCNASGAYTTAPDAYQLTASASGTVVKPPDQAIDSEVKRRILNNGRYRLQDQSFTMLSGYGLRHLSMGVGADGFVAMSLSGAYTAANNASIGAGNYNNGTPWQGNRQKFKPLWPIKPGQNIQATIQFGTSITGFTQSTNRFGLYLFGWLIQVR